MEEQYFYHVISDVPKCVGEHLILDEDHPNSDDPPMELPGSGSMEMSMKVTPTSALTV